MGLPLMPLPSFIDEVENHMILNPMNVNQQICFTLQLIEGDSMHWKKTALVELQDPVPPAWENDWDLFKGEFNLRFKDTQEQDCAAYAITTSKVVQMGSVCKFMDYAQDTC